MRSAGSTFANGFLRCVSLSLCVCVCVCVFAWKLAQNMPQLGIPCGLYAHVAATSFSFRLFLPFASPLLLRLLHILLAQLHFAYARRVCMNVCVCVCVSYIRLNHVKSCMLIVRLFPKMPQLVGNWENAGKNSWGKCASAKQDTICIFG